MPIFALQIRVDGTTKNTLEYEIVQVVDTGPILRDMAFSVDHEHLYIMSEKQVRNPVSPLWFMLWTSELHMMFCGKYGYYKDVLCCRSHDDLSLETIAFIH